MRFRDYLKTYFLSDNPGYPYNPGESSFDTGTAADTARVRQELLGYLVTFSQRAQDAIPTVDNLNTILAGVVGLAGAMGGKGAFCSRLQGVEVRIRDIDMGGYGQAHGVSFNRNSFDTWTVVHELGHAWDGVNGWDHCKSMQRSVHAGYREWWHGLPHLLWRANPRFWYYPGDSPPPCGIDQNFNAKEDFAEAVTAYIFPDLAKTKAIARGWPYNDPARGYHYSSYAETPRANFIRGLLVSGSGGRG